LLRKLNSIRRMPSIFTIIEKCMEVLNYA